MYDTSREAPRLIIFSQLSCRSVSSIVLFEKVELTILESKYLIVNIEESVRTASFFFQPQTAACKKFTIIILVDFNERLYFGLFEIVHFVIDLVCAHAHGFDFAFFEMVMYVMLLMKRGSATLVDWRH